MKLGLRVLPVLVLGIAARAAQNLDHLRVLGAQGINLWKLEKAAASAANPKLFTQGDGSELIQETEDDIAGFKAQWFRQPLDHFDKSSNATFRQRYWVNMRHYNPEKGGPVIVLDGGETSGMVCTPLDAGPLSDTP